MSKNIKEIKKIKLLDFMRNNLYLIIIILMIIIYLCLVDNMSAVCNRIQDDTFQCYPIINIPLVK